MRLPRFSWGHRHFLRPTPRPTETRISDVSFWPQGPLDIPAPKSRGNAAPAPSSEKAANSRCAGANGVPALASGTGGLHSSLDDPPLIPAPSLALPSQPTRGQCSLAQCCFGQERAAQPRQGALAGCPAPSPSTPPDCNPNFGLSAAQVTLIPPARAPFSCLSRLVYLTHPFASRNTNFHCF